MYNQRIIARLKQAGISFEDGMSETELNRAESVFHFHFPKEIREFLSSGLPVGDSFFNYRDLSESNVTRFWEFQMSIEKDFCFDLTNNREEMFEMLGQKLGFAQCSESFDNAVLKYLHDSVKLIPFYAHRCFFDGMDDMPIVSFWQPVDTILYGGNFENYLAHEFLAMDCVIENVQERMEATGIWNDLIW